MFSQMGALADDGGCIWWHVPGAYGVWNGNNLCILHFLSCFIRLSAIFLYIFQEVLFFYSNKTKKVLLFIASMLL